MQRGKFLAVLVLVAFVAFVVPHPASGAKIEAAKPNQAINVACVFATGGLEDKSFNDMAKAGLDKAIADGLMNSWTNGSSYSEPDEIAEYDQMLEDYATGDYDLIVSIGFDQATAVNTTALANPTQPIVLIDMVVFQGNVRSVVFAANEGSFLVGAMAGLMTETDKIGFVGGMDIPLIREFWAGYKAGALHENNDIKVVEAFVGDWGDPTAAKSMAEVMWADDVDIIFAAAGSSGLGVLESASEKNKYAIGVDADQDWVHEGDILCSMMKRVDVAVYNAVKDVHGGTWTSGFVSMGLAANGVGISPLTYTSSVIGATKIQRVNVTLRDMIVNGSITVPTDKTSLDEWCKDMGIETAGDEAPGFSLLVAFGGLAIIPILFRRRQK